MSIKEEIAFLEGYVTQARKKRMYHTLANRTRHMTVVLEDIFQDMNASAVLRHCDALGIQDVHIIENRNRFRTNKDVDLGTAQWLTLERYNQEENNSRQCLQALKKKGYKIVATTPHEKSITLEDLDPCASPMAMVFGTEKTGISQIVREEADIFMAIPMYGFVESFNISASCAMTLYQLVHRLRRERNDWHLQQEEQEIIYHQWLRNSIKHCEKILDHWYKERDGKPDSS